MSLVVEAISLIVIDPVDQRIRCTRTPLIELSATRIRQYSSPINNALDADTAVVGVLSTVEIDVRQGSHFYVFDHTESFILVLDSGAAERHCLYLCLFHPKQRPSVEKVISKWRVPNSDSRGGSGAAGWYRVSVLRQFTNEFEFFLDSHGDPCDVAIPSSTHWIESGVSAIFNKPTTRTLTSLLKGNTHASVMEMSESAASSWMGEATIQKRLVATMKSVPSVRQLFQF